MVTPFEKGTKIATLWKIDREPGVSIFLPQPILLWAFFIKRRIKELAAPKFILLLLLNDFTVQQE